MGPVGENRPHLSFASDAEWAAWLEEHHDASDGVWLRIAKKGAPEPSVSHQEALRVALCFGWIDAQGAPLDEMYWLQRFTPRRPRGRWSKRNTEIAERLIAEGRMRPAGMREVELAKADGRWEKAYAGQRTAQVPPDLEKELTERPQARAFFESLDSANRYAILYRIEEAKRPETRARRIEKYVAMLEAGEKIHP